MEDEGVQGVGDECEGASLSRGNLSRELGEEEGGLKLISIVFVVRTRYLSFFVAMCRI